MKCLTLALIAFATGCGDQKIPQCHDEVLPFNWGSCGSQYHKLVYENGSWVCRCQVNK